MAQRDSKYQLNQFIELDGAEFGTIEKTKVLVAVETKTWQDENGKENQKAGFAKIQVASETKEEAQNFVEEVVKVGSFINTDGSKALRNLENFSVDYQVMDGKKDRLDQWLPWVHTLIGNAKTWINGTHHGVSSKYLGKYLSEFIYRFNRRHSPPTMFHRMAFAVCSARLPAPTG